MSTVRREALGVPMSFRTRHWLRRSSHVRASRTSSSVGTASCKSRVTLTIKMQRQDLCMLGYHRCHGEARIRTTRCTPKAALEASVRIIGPRFGAVMQREPDRLVDSVWSVRVRELSGSCIAARRFSGSEARDVQNCQGYSRPPTASRELPVNAGTSNRAPGPATPASRQAR